MYERICPAEEILSEYLAGKLKGEHKERVEKHLAGCGICRELLAETHDIVKTLGFSPAGRTALVWIKKNYWSAGAFCAFAASFLFPRYFLQFIACGLLLGAKWIMEAKTTKMLITVYEALRGGERNPGGEELSRSDIKKPGQ